MDAKWLVPAIRPTALEAPTRRMWRRRALRSAARQLITEVRDLPLELGVPTRGGLDRLRDLPESVRIVRRFVNDGQRRRTQDSKDQLPQPGYQDIVPGVVIAGVATRGQTRIPHHRQTVDHGASEPVAGLVQLSHLSRVTRAAAMKSY
jgi:hypothetical protein